LIIAAFWAAIYLPGLGSAELKGEEGRRILPAITMLETGNWVVPYVGGEPYLRKPPLVNWLIASSIWATGHRDEWSARIPITLSVLALGLVIGGVCSDWLGARTATAAALFAIAHVAIIEKGRLAEIEGLYVALSGIAIVTWLAWSLQRKSSWLVWTLPFAFNGLALLAKGPAHLIFFYAVVLATPRGRREILSVAHLSGLILMVGIFATWAVPYFDATRMLHDAGEGARASGVWFEQIKERLGGGSFVWRDWLLGTPRGLSNFLPWLLLVPFWWRHPSPEPWFRSVRNTVTAVYICFLLIPGFLPRYTMPLLVPAGLLMAVALRDAVLPWWHRFRERFASLRVPAAADLGVATIGATLAALIVIAYAALLPSLKRYDDLRPLGRAISSAVPPGEPLVVYDPEFQPMLFYVSAPLKYESKFERLPAAIPWVLAKEKDVAKFRRNYREFVIHEEFKERDGKRLLLLTVADKRGADASIRPVRR
jgi:4-amino-4-deoxy-L-arabinose transferase-like glycosyltransferase